MMFDKAKHPKHIYSDTTTAGSSGPLPPSREELQAEIDYLKLQYYDLIYRVESKHPGKTRHETAASLITKAQRSDDDRAKAALRQEEED